MPIMGYVVLAAMLEAIAVLAGLRLCASNNLKADEHLCDEPTEQMRDAA